MKPRPARHNVGKPGVIARAARATALTATRARFTLPAMPPSTCDPSSEAAADGTGTLCAASDALYGRTLSRLQHGKDLWVFGYASLIWRPEFHAAEQRPARVHGFHRALRMASSLNRGTPQQPGLVFALLPGGSCRGMVYRIERERAQAELRRLWAREMPGGVYDPKWLQCQTAAGPVSALAFTLNRRSPSYTGVLDEDALLAIFRQARGRFGTTLDYLVETARCLRRYGIRDRAVERHVALARRHGLAS